MNRLLLSRVLGCLALALLMMSSWAADPLHRLPGFDNVDLWDTVMLRGAVASLLGDPGQAPWTQAVFAPSGYPILELTPNLLDHLTGAVFDALLPFPLSDGLWWLCVLTLNGLAAHALGLRLGGSEGAGWLGAVAFALSEPIAREANLHHAPQAMAFWGPWFVLALLRLRDAPSSGAAGLAGLLLGLAGLSYWYGALFLVLGCLPLFLGLAPLRLAQMSLVTALVSAPFLLPFLLSWGEIPLTAGAEPPPAVGMPEGIAALGAREGFVAWHGNDPAFFLRSEPMDISNRVSPVLLLAAVLGFVKGGDAPRARWLWMAGLGAVMVLGPVLMWAQEPVRVGGHTIPLPFAGLRALHPFLERLTWPERFGVLIPLGLLALAVRAPRPTLWALALVVESVVLSHNLPLRSVDLAQRSCHAELAAGAPGAVLELPLRRPGMMSQRPGVHRRFHGRDSANAILLPPGTRPPEAWEQWQDGQPLLRAFDRLDRAAIEALGPDEVERLRASGVAVVALDAEPGVLLRRAELERTVEALSEVLGEPVDLGCVVAWWLDGDPPRSAPAGEGAAWREAAWEATQQHQEEELPTLIRPARPRGGWDQDAPRRPEP